MNVKSDIEIAQSASMLPIQEVAAKLGLTEDMLETYGRYKAKVDVRALQDLPCRAKLVLVTAISPTPAGEGKTTTSVGLADALNRIGKRTVVCLREPLPGPCLWCERRSGRRRLCPGGSHGGHQPPLHRRLSRHRRGK